MNSKTRILFIPVDKKNIMYNMISKDVIAIKYKYETDTYTTLHKAFTHAIKHSGKLLNIKSIGILTTKIDTGISILNGTYINVNAPYDTNIQLFNFESWIQYMSTALQLINTEKQLIQLDIIASGVVSNKSANILSTISKNAGIIINTAREDIYNYNCILDYSTRYVDGHCNRSLIGRYFTHNIIKLTGGLNITISKHDIITDISNQITDICKHALDTLQIKDTRDIWNSLKIIAGAISSILNIGKLGIILHLYNKDSPDVVGDAFKQNPLFAIFLTICPPITFFIVEKYFPTSWLDNANTIDYSTLVPIDKIGLAKKPDVLSKPAESAEFVYIQPVIDGKPDFIDNMTPKKFILITFMVIMSMIELIGEYEAVKWLSNYFTNPTDIRGCETIKTVKDIKQGDIKLNTLSEYIKICLNMLPDTPLIDSISPDSHAIVHLSYELCKIINFLKKF